ncbi:Armadillo-like helical [Penicillium macrosclerotiorum]|uniref:Armadillo-like helical n=1 Tax=Penicillium macrosclerotiorum TaxID=303699 RepID=UPI0025495137|nr:Armadillo-like helical [Penicillium macrosclerotiorum]KAJ5669065.1 Armadillo-like helical [Penicillium macrosclerotiorum]
MEHQRQDSFKKLREPCVELSSVGLRFRGNQASAPDLYRALEPVYNVLEELAGENVLDEKLAEYAFFPLSHIFNETQRLPARCLELSVRCLNFLIADGWRQKLSPALGKQLIILLTLIVGGYPSKTDENQTPKSQAPEELAIVCFDCLSSIFKEMQGPVAQQTVFHDIGTATIIDQTVYILLEGVVDDRSDDLCISAAKAIQALYGRITDRLVLASIMPRTVSALAKVVRPTTQVRRSFKLLQICLQVMSQLLRAVLNDIVCAESKTPASSQSKPDTMTLDASWLKATTTQIKLALVNIIQIRRHQRPEVKSALLNLCIMIIEECQTTLADAVPMMVETVVVLADQEDEVPNEAYKTLIHLATTYAVVLDSLKESLHTWLTSFPRIMQSNDESAKQWGIRQISTVFQILSQFQIGSDILTGNLASGLCDSVGAVVKRENHALQPIAAPGDIAWEVLGTDSTTITFPSVLLDHQSQRQTLKDMRSMVMRLNASESGNEITRSILNRLHSLSGDSTIAPFWLALTSLRAQSQQTSGFDDFIADDYMEQTSSLSQRAGMIEELYYTSLNILNDVPADGSGDWRISGLALEAVALQAQQLGESFRPELMDALYPTLQILASNNQSLQRHAMTCLNILTKACNYPDPGSMIIENVDYLVNSVALKLNTFDVSPYPPQVLFMMVKLCGARLVPYLEDLVDSIFGILDLYHGYPKLVEMMFKTLAAVVEEGSLKPSLLTIDAGKESGPSDSRKSKYNNLSILDLAADIANRKSKRSQTAEDDKDAEEKIAHPKKPWSETYEKPPAELESIEELLNKAESDEPLPPPTEPEDQEKPLSKTHSLLLHIVKSIPSHLSSPSPYLRRSLLSILIQVLPTLSQNENSFLPLINELWPSVASRVIFPSSIASDKSSSTLMTKSSPESTSHEQHDTQTYQEETFVITAACQAIEAMCKGAGDFMATRIETEFPRWQRLYQRVWFQVRDDAEAVNARRNRQQEREKSISKPGEQALDVGFVLTASLALSPITAGSRAFTPHHSIWRALISLFLTVLANVRLPQNVGDQICSILGSWIAILVGPDYYFQASRQSIRAQVDDSQRDIIDSIESALNAMETWNPDLTWFFFAIQESKVKASREGIADVGMSVDAFGQTFKFAEVAF